MEFEIEVEVEVEVGCYLWRWSSAINRALNLSFDLQKGENVVVIRQWIKYSSMGDSHF